MDSPKPSAAVEKAREIILGNVDYYVAQLRGDMDTFIDTFIDACSEQEKASTDALAQQLSDIAIALNAQPGKVWYKAGAGTLAEQVAVLVKEADANAKGASDLRRLRELWAKGYGKCERHDTTGAAEFRAILGLEVRR